MSIGQATVIGFAVLFVAFGGLSTGGTSAPMATPPVDSGGGHPLAVAPLDVPPGGSSGEWIHRLATVPLTPNRPAALSGQPAWLAYDSADERFFVAVPPSSIEVVPGNFGDNPIVIGTIPVGIGPFGVAYDNATGDVYVTNSQSANVSVINASSMGLVATIPVGSGPMGVAYDPVTRDVYVANNGSNNVSIISDSRFAVVGTVDVGTAPLGVAADPSTGDVFVANHGSSNLSVISGTTNRLATSIALPSGPYGVTIDVPLQRVYVTDQTAANVSAISEATNSVLANISIPCTPGCGELDLEGLAYDSGDGLIYVGGGQGTVLVISPSNNSLLQELNFDPAGVAYDPDTGDICVTNTANQTFECAMFEHPSAGGPYSVQFSETGLPPGSAWYAFLDGTYGQSTGSSITFAVANGSFPYSVGKTDPPYADAPDPASGLVTVLGANVTLPIDFSTATYLVEVVETGLPTGTPWSAELGLATSATTSDRNWFNVSNGTYELSLGSVLNYTGSPLTSKITVNGSSLVVNVAYASPKEPHYPVTFTEAGLAAGTTWSVTFSGENSTTSSGSILFNASNGTYGYLVSAAGYSASPPNGAITVQGGPQNQSIVFNSTELWQVTLHETGLPFGTDWGVLIGSDARSSTSSDIDFEQLNGTYGYLVLPIAGYVVASPPSIVVNGANQVVPVVFSPQLYPIVFVELGLPAGTNWSVTVTDNATGFNQSLASTASSIIFFLPNGTYSVAFHLPSGYNGTATSTSITVAGRAATGATVSVAAPASSPRPAPSSKPALEPLVLVLALALAVIALLVVLVVIRRSRRPPSQPNRVAN